MRLTTRPFEPFATCEARIPKARSGFSSGTTYAIPGSRTASAADARARPFPFEALLRFITGITRRTVPMRTAIVIRSTPSIPRKNGGVFVSGGTATNRSTWLVDMFTARGAEMTVSPSTRTATTLTKYRVRVLSRISRSVRRIHWLQPEGFVLREETVRPSDVTFTQAFETRSRPGRFDSTSTWRKFRTVMTEFTWM